MADARRRYLRIQSELGGPEVYLRASGSVPTAAPEPAPPPAPVKPAAPAAPKPEPGAQASPDTRSGAGEADWRTGAPPIPGPGLEIVLPVRGLLDQGPDYGSLDKVVEAVRVCERCALSAGRTNTVPGEGSPVSGLMCIGEGPGETEDQTGRPFVGRAGELLTGILKAIGLPRESVYIANVVKCRPPGNRKPLADEMSACLPYLQAQIRLLRPRVILALGATAAEGLLGTRQSLGSLRGKVHRYDGVPLVVTYHPAALLRNPNWKKPTWDDVRIARQLLDA